MNNKFKLVNWIDGMSINSDNFRQTENYFIESITDAKYNSLSNYNYGLLPLKQETDTYGIRVREYITDSIEVSLDSCNAITRAGVRVKFNVDTIGEPLVNNYSPTDDPNNKDQKHTHWDIIITVNPYKREAIGELNLNEAPFRHPNARECYTLSVTPKGTLNIDEYGIFSLIVGRIHKDGNMYMYDNNYIPPSINMLSHPDLLNYYVSFADYFQSMDNASRNIISKIQNGTNSSELAQNINIMCKDIMRYIGTIHFRYKNMGKYMAPVEIVNFISTFSNTCYINLLSLSRKQKDELLKYFYEWSDVPPGTFEEVLSGALEIVYDHNDIRAVMVHCEHVLVMMKDLLNRLNRLEFIGQHKENIIVSERGGQYGNSSHKSWIID